MSKRRKRMEATRTAVHARGTVPPAPTEIPESAAALRRYSLAAWLVIAAFGVALLFIALGPHRVGGLDAESDFYGGYAPAAVRIQHGHLVADHGKLPAVFGFVGPLYPALLALGGFALGDLFSAAELLSVVASVAVVVCWFLLLRRRVSAKLAFVTVLLLVTNPQLARYGYSVTTDTTAIAFQAAALFLLFARAGLGNTVAAGVFAGLAILTRYSSAYLLPAGLFAILAGATLHSRRPPAAQAYLLGCLALVVPWQIYGRLHGAEVQFHQLLAFDMYGSARGMSWDNFLANVWPRFEHAPLTVFTSDPGAVARRLLFNLGEHLKLDGLHLLGMPVVICVALTPLLAILDRRLLRLIPLATAGACAYLLLVPAPASERYSLAVLPFYLLLASGSLTVGVGRFAGGRGPALLRTAIVVAVAALTLKASIREQRQVLEQQPLEIVTCAERLRSLARPGDRLMARKPNLAFHAGVGSVYFPSIDSLAALASYARANRARWLYVSPSEVQLRPRTAFLLDTSAVTPGLTLRAYTSVPVKLDDLAWRRVAALYEIGDAFGESPSWFADPPARTLHILRGMAVTLPDARVQLRLAAAELRALNLDRAQAAWRDAARIDPKGVATFVDRFKGDTLTAVARGQALLQ